MSDLKKNFMIDRKIFSKRLRWLRMVHGLSNEQLSILLNFKSKGSISAFESTKSIPSGDILVYTSNLFAVSLDWLLGRSNIPYSEELMTDVEFNLWNTVTINMKQLKEIVIDFPPIPEKYKNEKRRSKLYSLKLRANIVFLVSVIFSTAMAAKSLDNKNVYQNNYYLQTINDNYSVSVTQLLESLTAQKTKKPFFDISDISEQPIKRYACLIKMI